MFKFSIIGNPIEHSQSPLIHQAFAKQFNLSIQYTKIKSELNHFAATLRQFQQEGGHGCNVTAPFKEEAYALATELTLRAKLAKSVNALLLQPSGEIKGDNTDGVGFIKDVTQNLKFSLKDKTILIVGAGGAVRGILHPLLEQNPFQVILINRTFSKSKILAKEFQLYGNIEAVEKLSKIKVDMVIDGTSSDKLTGLDSVGLTSHSLCYDLKYHQTKTSFMQWAKEQDATFIADGHGMLLEQAAEAFFVWTGKRPSI